MLSCRVIDNSIERVSLYIERVSLYIETENWLKEHFVTTTFCHFYQLFRLRL